EIAVRIYWKNTRDYNEKNFITLIACLPNESKEILHNNEIDILTPTSKTPMFNYASFCKSLSTYNMYYYTRRLLCKNHQSRDLEDKTSILLQEIIKLFTGQISSLKRLYLEIGSSCSSFNTLTIYPKAKD